MEILKFIDPIKTIYFNLKMFTIEQAPRIPVFIGYNTIFISLKGKIKIESTLKTGMVRFGFGSVGIVDKRFTRTLLN